MLSAAMERPEGMPVSSIRRVSVIKAATALLLRTAPANRITAIRRIRAVLLRRDRWEGRLIKLLARLHILSNSGSASRTRHKEGSILPKSRSCLRSHWFVVPEVVSYVNACLREFTKLRCSASGFDFPFYRAVLLSS